MGRMYGVASESLGTLKGAVQHYVAVRGLQAPVNDHPYVQQSGHLPGKALKAFLDAPLHLGLLLGRQLRIKCPENNMLYHKQ